MSAFRSAEAIGAAWRGPLYFVLENSMAYVIYLGVLLVRSRRALLTLAPLEGWRALWEALGTITSYSLVLRVLQTESLSYVVAVRQSSVLIAPAIRWVAFRERLAGARALPAALIAFGVVLVASLGR